MEDGKAARIHGSDLLQLELVLYSGVGLPGGRQFEHWTTEQCVVFLDERPRPSSRQVHAVIISIIIIIIIIISITIMITAVNPSIAAGNEGHFRS